MIKLITAAYLKAETDIDTNVDNRDLDNPIKQAQDRLRFLLGRRFYDQLYSQGSSTPTAFSPENSALFDPYVKQFLAWQAHELYRIKSTAVTKRTGLRVYKDETDDAAPESIINLHIKTAKEQTQFYKGEMINYILQEQENDATAFPLYDDDCDNNKFGTGSGITGVGKLSTSQWDIGLKTDNNGD
jgi:hypothetical protein